jgi:hypothetical protein
LLDRDRPRLRPPAALEGRHDERRRLAELNDLAAYHCATGQLRDAAPLLQRVVAGCQEHLGRDDPDTVIGHGNLAVVLLQLDRRGAALPLIEANVQERRRVFGDLHPATLHARDALAVAYEWTGRAAEAAELFGAVARDREDVLGRAHPDTLLSRLGHARAGAAAGDTGRAAGLLDAMVEEAEQALGSAHPVSVLLAESRACCHADLAEQERAEFGEPLAAGTPEARALPAPRGARFPRRRAEGR